MQDLSPIPCPEDLPAPATVRGEERVWEEDLEILTPHYGIEDVPPPAETLLYAWQHTLVDVSPFVLPMIVAGSAGPLGRLGYVRVFMVGST